MRSYIFFSHKKQNIIYIPLSFSLVITLPIFNQCFHTHFACNRHCYCRLFLFFYCAQISLSKNNSSGNDERKFTYNSSSPSSSSFHSVWMMLATSVVVERWKNKASIEAEGKESNAKKIFCLHNAVRSKINIHRLYFPLYVYINDLVCPLT